MFPTLERQKRAFLRLQLFVPQKRKSVRPLHLKVSVQFVRPPVRPPLKIAHFRAKTKGAEKTPARQPQGCFFRAVPPPSELRYNPVPTPQERPPNPLLRPHQPHPVVSRTHAPHHTAPNAKISPSDAPNPLIRPHLCPIPFPCHTRPHSLISRKIPTLFPQNTDPPVPTPAP